MTLEEAWKSGVHGAGLSRLWKDALPSIPEREIKLVEAGLRGAASDWPWDEMDVCYAWCRVQFGEHR